jgi:16S rRNA (cytidine1402-2'-O)-methyltransferase
MSGTLYVVATPIGNLTDLSPRAADTLRAVDLIACEDTRHTRKLLTHFGIATPTSSYHEHNEKSRTPVLLRRLAEGRSIALVSDAGTPLLSDPGFRLVRACRQSEIPVFPVPGAFAAAAALSVSGLPTDRVLFLGFPSDRSRALESELEALRSCRATLVFYLAPHRLHRQLDACRKILGNREAFLAREMTKLHEEAYFGSLDQLREAVGDLKARGEYTLVVEGAAESVPPVPSLDVAAYVAGLTTRRGLTKQSAVKKASRDLGLPRREVYRASVAEGESGGGGGREE